MFCSFLSVSGFLLTWVHLRSRIVIGKQLVPITSFETLLPTEASAHQLPPHQCASRGLSSPLLSECSQSIFPSLKALKEAGDFVLCILFVC